VVSTEVPWLSLGGLFGLCEMWWPEAVKLGTRMMLQVALAGNVAGKGRFAKV